MHTLSRHTHLTLSTHTIHPRQPTRTCTRLLPELLSPLLAGKTKDDEYYEKTVQAVVVNFGSSVYLRVPSQGRPEPHHRRCAVYPSGEGQWGARRDPPPRGRQEERGVRHVQHRVCRRDSGGGRLRRRQAVPSTDARWPPRNHPLRGTTGVFELIRAHRHTDTDTDTHTHTMIIILHRRCRFF